MIIIPEAIRRALTYYCPNNAREEQSRPIGLMSTENLIAIVLTPGKRLYTHVGLERIKSNKLPKQFWEFHKQADEAVGGSSIFSPATAQIVIPIDGKNDATLHEFASGNLPVYEHNGKLYSYDEIRDIANNVSMPGHLGLEKLAQEDDMESLKKPDPVHFLLGEDGNYYPSRIPIYNKFTNAPDVADFIGCSGANEIGWIPMYNMDAGLGRTTVTLDSVVEGLKHKN